MEVLRPYNYTTLRLYNPFINFSVSLSEGR